MLATLQRVWSRLEKNPGTLFQRNPEPATAASAEFGANRALEQTPFDRAEVARQLLVEAMELGAEAAGIDVIDRQPLPARISPAARLRSFASRRSISAYLAWLRSTIP